MDNFFRFLNGYSKKSMEEFYMMHTDDTARHGRNDQMDQIDTFLKGPIVWPTKIMTDQVI